MLQRLGDEYSYPNVDRRKSVRYEFSVGIEIEWCSKKYWGRGRNLSRHGTFIELPGLSALTLLNVRCHPQVALFATRPKDLNRSPRLLRTGKSRQPSEARNPSAFQRVCNENFLDLRAPRSVLCGKGSQAPCFASVPPQSKRDNH